FSTSSDGSDVEPLYIGLCAGDKDSECGNGEVDGDCAGTCVGPIWGDCTDFGFGNDKGVCTGVGIDGHHGGGGGHHDDDDDGGWHGGKDKDHGKGGWWPHKGWGGKHYAGGKGAASVQASIKALPTTGAGDSAGNTNELML